jgi:5-formyltetrahydrofolate cyclo-ligase
VAELFNQKQQLRQEYRQRRSALGEAVRSQASQAICQLIGTWPNFQHAETVLVYLPIRGEVDLTGLLEQFPQKQWVLPRILPAENHRMVFHPYVAGRLVRHPLGMAEPDAGLPLILPGEVQLALVPGLAFDRQGWRLGYGGGYFDRFLANFAGISLGVVFEVLRVEQLPHGNYDVPVHWLVTEAGLFEASKAK